MISLCVRNTAALAGFTALMALLVAVFALSRDQQPLALAISGFVETIDPARIELGQITDLSTSTMPEDTPTKPRFELKGFPVLSIEARGPDPYRDIMFLYQWWDAKGVGLGVRDSYHMLRASFLSRADFPQEEQDKARDDRDYVDIFANIPARVGATQTAFYIQDSGLFPGDRAPNRKLTIYGQQIDRADTLTSVKALSDGTSYAADVSFPPTTGREISGRGVRFRVGGVAAVFTVLANHRLKEHEAGQYLIGAMAPQVIGYRTTAGEYRTLSFSATDLLRLDFDPIAKTLAVDAYAYEFRERTTRASMAYPNASRVRIHPNLGVVDKLPAQTITISHSRSDVLAFPLWQPNGALASFAITEHADFVGILQDTLTMYGSQEPVAVPGKGIIGNGVPLTKTVFPAGPQMPFRGVTASSAVKGDFIKASVIGEPGYRQMLQRYRDEGRAVEIGVHCVATDQVQATRTTSHVAKALDEMDEFKPVTWVDHGGRDCLWESGWDPSSEFYIIPLLRKHGFKYVNMLGDKYDGRINMIADGQPSNLLFYSVGLDDDLSDDWRPIVFNTVPIGFTRDNLTPEHLQHIIDARGLINIHTYLPYETLMVERKADGLPKLRTNPWYDAQMANLAAAGRSGDLHLGTARQLNDYMWKVRALHVRADGPAILVKSARGEAIPGLTIGYVSMTGLPHQAVVTDVLPLGGRARDGASYLWFDLARG